MTDSLYIRVDDVEVTDPKSGHKLPWKRATVFFNGDAVVTGHAPNFGIDKKDGIVESSAVSIAQSEFCRKFLSDIRGKSDDDQTPWVQSLVDSITRRHSVSGRHGEGSEGSA